MDSFSYYLQDIRPLLLDNMDFPVNSLGKSNNHVKDSALKSIHDLVLDGEIVEGTEIVESAFPHMVGEFLLGNSVIKSQSTSVFNIDQLTQDLGFGSELLDTGYNHSDKKEILVDPETLTDFKQGYSKMSSGESIVSSLVENSLLTKRARTTNLHSQIPLCQVQGCYKDLSSSKDYHKRHRVCGVHAKSAKVIIKGIEKRFCQQCSRFHLLKEFDDVKRSCRKRLAGHNERRRKPHIGSHIGADSSLLEMDLLKSASFLLTEEHPASFYYQEKYADDNQSKRMRLEKVPGAGAGAGEVEFPMPLDYGCAPSLLSFTSKLSSNSPEMAALNPTIIGSSPAYKSSTLNSFIQMEHIPTCTRNQKGPTLCDGSTVVCSDTQRYYYKDCRTPEAGPTLDLLHLSSHLRRVEKLQNSVQVKQEM